MAPLRKSLLALGAASAGANENITQCIGSIGVDGYGDVHLVATEWNMPGIPAAPVLNTAGNVRPEMWGRAYFANACTEGTYDYTDYSSMQLLGKKLSFTTDISGAGCGCNAAMYLVSMPQNPEISGCHDFYCDANTVCGVNCAEIDIMEANRFAFHSAVHKAWDGNGEAAGFGGWVQNNQFAFDASQYGPQGSCIDTGRPFRVETSFPVGANGKLVGMEVTLSQDGTSCDVGLAITQYQVDPDWEALTKALADGMTPVVSYWKAENMLWLDGPGVGGGPCIEDTQLCVSPPQFYAFSLEDLPMDL